MKKRSTRSLAASCLACIAGMQAVAWAGIVIGARRSEDMPRLVLNVNGPSGTIRSLGFSADSKRLYAGGMDKAVHAWELLNAGAVGKAAPIKALRWEIARGLRGVIYAVAVSPTDQRVAIAGLSTRSQSGDVVIYDVAGDRIETALRDHGQSVVSMAFSPDGNRLATCSQDGEIRVYAVGSWTSVQLRAPSKEGMFPRPIAFAGSNALVTVGATQAEQTRVTIYALGGEKPAGQTRSFAAPRPIVALTADKVGKYFASSDNGGNLFRWDVAGDGDPQLLRAGLAASSMAIGGDDFLLVATLFRDGPKTGGMLEAYRLSTGEPIDRLDTSEQVENLAVAVSPDGRLAACSGATPLEVLLFSLVGGDGNPIEKPLTGAPKLAIQNRGRPPLKVAFAAEGHGIGYGFKPQPAGTINNAGTIESSFDFKSFEWKPASKDAQWRSPEIAGWTVVLDASRRSAQLMENGRPTGVVRLNPATTERLYSYCWLTDERQQPYAIAVGTDVQHGVYIYGLASEGDCPLLRYYRDHADWVTSLSVSADGKFLASASGDLTIKIWNLDGLRAAGAAQRAIVRQGRGFSKQAAWGANFEIRNDAVVVTSIAPAGIANSRGLRAGDVVSEATFGGAVARAMNRNGPTMIATSAEEILAGLEATPLHEQALLTVKRLGRPLPQQFLLVPAWEPLLTFFADERGEWASWTPQGYYAASTQGDSLFGWQINRGVDVKPDFYRADQFRGDLEKPDVMKRLFQAGSTPGALLAANLSIPDALDTVINNAADSVALVTITDPPDGQSSNGQPVRVVAKIAYRDGRPVTDTDAKAYINGVPISNRKVIRDAGSATVEWNVTPPDPFSRVRVVAAKASQGDAANYAFADVHVRSIDVARRPRLHAVAIAVSEYPKPLELEFPIVDAESVIEKLWTGKQGIYEPGFVKKLYNKDVSRDSLSKLIDQIKSELGDAPSGDLLVVFLAGHGVAFGNEYYFIPPDQRLKNLTPEKAEGVVKEVGVPWTQLRQLSNLPCRKVFFLDTCFAGNTLLTEGVSRHMKSAIRPLTRDEVLVLAATAENQPALESSSLGHGAFSKCLLDGLSGNAVRKGTSDVDLAGISDYLEVAVPQITGQRQTPRSSPTELLDLIFVPLVRTAHPPTAEPFRLR